MFTTNINNRIIKLYQNKIFSNTFSNLILKEKYESKVKNSELGNETSLNLTYTKIDKNYHLFNELLLTIVNRKYRDKNSQIIIEGRRLILDAISCGVKLNKIIFSQKDELSLIKEELSKLTNFEIYKASHHNLQLWSTLTTQPGLLGIFTRPNTPLKQFTNTQCMPLTVICDNIREPNNLGSIIRICAALPCTKIIILKGCTDPWETKALRSGCGGHFRINIKTNCKWDDMAEYLPEKSSVFIADCNIFKMKERCIDIKQYSEVRLSENNFLIIGGETHGISEEAYSFLKCTNGSGIHIPLANNVDSLNTASALSIILFSLRENMLKSN